MRRLLLLAMLLVLLPAAPAGAQDRVQGRVQETAPVVVLGVAGLRWDHVTDATPALQALARRGAVGALSVKALPAVTCRADGWLTLAAGTRAQAYGGARPCTEALPTDLVAQARRNLDSRDGADLGVLRRSLGAGLRTRSPGAELVAQPGVPPVAGSGEVTAGPYSRVVELLDLGSVTDAGSLARLDARIAQVVAELAPRTDLLVVGLSEGPGQGVPRLHLALAAGPSFPRGTLRSGSTRRDGYVQLIDVAPTLLQLLGAPVPTAVDGRPWTVAPGPLAVGELVDLDRRAQGQRSATVPFFVVLLAAPLGLGALLRRRPRAAELVALAGVAALGAAFLAGLAPWWRAGVPLLGLLVVVVPVALAVGAAARSLTRGAGTAAAAQAVCAFVAGVVLIDLLTGAHLQIGSVAGYSPLVAGRFAGIGNVAFGVLAACTLLAAGASGRARTIAGVGVLVVVVDGAPPFGSDVGGVLALVPALVLLALLRTGTRVTPARLLLAAGGGVAVVTAFGLADLARAPADRTHLGRFVQDVVDGTAGQLLARKASAVVDLLLTSPVTAGLPLVVAAAAYAVIRPPAPLRAAFDAAPGWRHGLLAVGLVSLLGFALNDSGAAVPALALCVVLPATAAVVGRARQPPPAPARL